MCRKISLFEKGESFSVDYNKYDRTKADSPIVTYDTFKITVMLSDNLAAIANGRLYNTCKGDILFFRPDELHHGRFLKDGTYEFLDFYLPLTFFNNYKEESQILAFMTDTSDTRINCIRPDYDEKKKIISATKKIRDLVVSGKDNSDTKIYAIMLQIILFLCDTYENQKKSPVYDDVPIYVLKTISYITEHLTEKISINELASYAGCSVTYLSQVFKKHTGSSVYNYILEMRIKYAQKLLFDGSDVTETCYKCGFGDCSNFISAFKKITGITPLKYKKELWQNEQ